MREIVRMIVVLTAISSVAALLLAGVSQGTKEQRKMQVLKFIKGPAVREILTGSTNDPIKDARQFTPPAAAGAKASSPIDVFPAFKDGELQALAIETKGKGFGGEIGVILGVDMEAGEVAGIGITTHKETPGLGARIVEEGFRAGFKGLPLVGEVKVRDDGGEVDAISGATISSRGVCAAVTGAIEMFNENRAEIEGLF